MSEFAKSPENVIVGATVNATPLRNLLARIHRDGGHHTGAVGLEQSIVDAEAVVIELLAQADQQQRIERLERAIMELRGAVQKNQHGLGIMLAGWADGWEPNREQTDLPWALYEALAALSSQAAPSEGRTVSLTYGPIKRLEPLPYPRDDDEPAAAPSEGGS